MPTELTYVLWLAMADLVSVGLAAFQVVEASPIQSGVGDNSPRRACRRPSHPASAAAFPFYSTVRICPDQERTARGGGADPSSGCRHPRMHRLATRGRGRFTMTDKDLAEAQAKVSASDQWSWLLIGGVR